jgi:hypothetical protein
MEHDRDDQPIPVRIVTEDRYADTPEGRMRLTFDAWVYGILIVLTIVGSIFS